MKKIFLSILALSLFSCDVEQLDSSISTDDNGNGSNPTSGDYFPMAVNNLWVYNNGTSNSDMKITGTETLNSKTYYKCDNFMVSPDFGGIATVKYYFRKADNVYYQNYESTLNLMGAVSVSKPSDDIILLKDNLPVGGTWTQNLILNSTTTVDNETFTFSDLYVINGKILQKLTNYSVGGTTYPDVIKIEFKQTWTDEFSTDTTSSIIYFAKGVGPIQSISEDEDGVTYNSNLVSYSLN